MEKSSTVMADLHWYSIRSKGAPSHLSAVSRSWMHFHMADTSVNAPQYDQIAAYDWPWRWVGPSIGHLKPTTGCSFNVNSCTNGEQVSHMMEDIEIPTATLYTRLASYPRVRSALEKAPSSGGICDELLPLKPTHEPPWPSLPSRHLVIPAIHDMNT